MELHTAATIIAILRTPKNSSIRSHSRHAAQSGNESKFSFDKSPSQSSEHNTTA